MRNPARKALYCLLALVAAAAMIRLGFGREQSIGEHWTAIVPICIGLGIAPFAFVFLIQALFAIRGRAKLLRGEGVIARWQVFPGEWEQFRGLDSRRSDGRPGLGNDLWIRRQGAVEPVEVIVGRKSALVDGSYHSLNPRGLPELRGVAWLEGPPTCLEFSLLYPRSRYGGPVPTTLRIPVPPGARPDARRVVAHFEPLTRRHPPLALRDPPRTYWICVVLVFAGAAAGGIGYALAGGSQEGSASLVPLSLVIGGVICAVFASILALATWLLTRRT
ncbi:MAG TPA: hypothetical protein VE053_03885 [Allosphingosinicella sp.]|nr:hypothetical protein [Allosphingosinicella sp.]